MKKIYTPLLLAATALFGFRASAQTIPQYVFTQLTGQSYSAISGGTVVGTTTSDDQTFIDPANPTVSGTTGTGFPIGFNFTYGGNVYDRFAVNNNGYIFLGQSALSPAVNTDAAFWSTFTNPMAYTSSSAPATLQGRIAAFANDLYAMAGASLRLQTIGTTPNQTLVVQWQGYNNHGNSADNLNFQVRLYETSNVIDVAYGQMTHSNTGAGYTCQVGLRGSAATTDFNMRAISTSADWLNSVAATAITGTCDYEIHQPANGLTYRWIPPAPCAGAPPTSSVVSTFSTLCPGGTSSFTIATPATYSFTGLSYQWYSSTSGPTTGYSAITSATNAAFTDTNVPVTTAYRLVITCANGGASTTLTPVQVNVGAPPSVTTVASQSLICPGSTVNLTLPYSYSVANFAWQTATLSAFGPYTSAAGTNTNSTYAPPAANNTITTYYRAVVSCTANLTFSVATEPIVVNVQGVTINTIPYTEGFEGIFYNNQLPNCSWLTNNSNCQTYTVTQTQNRSARTGTKYASFSSASGTDYFYTNQLQLTAGITYSANMFYKTESTGLINFTELSMLVGAAQTPTALTMITTVGPAVSAGYTRLGGTFTVATTGLYNVAVKAVSTGGSYYLTWDDLSVTIPCAGTVNSPTLTATGPSSICLGTPVNVTVAGANTYSWNTGSVSNNITNTPVQTGLTTLMVTGTNTLSGCASVLTKTVNVFAGPLVSAFTTDPNNGVCPGSTAVLYAVGSATGYTWSTTGLAGANTTIAPTGNTTYTVIGSDASSCVTKTTIDIIIKDAPNVGGSTSAAAICLGSAVTLTGSGADTYTWTTNTGLYLTGNVINPSPTVPTNYNVTGTGPNGCTGVAVVAVNVDRCVGINNVTASNSNISVFPNPTTGEFTVSSDNSVKTIQVTDLSGRVLLTNTTSDMAVKFNINNLTAGVYFVKIKSGDNVNVVKVVKQ